jgi:hypothetical protein
MRVRSSDRKSTEAVPHQAPENPRSFRLSDNILAVALTIGQRRTAQGLIGGYMLKVDARHGVKSLFPASESYFLDRDCNEPLHATCWALAHLFALQLQYYPLTLYQLESAALARCAVLTANRSAAVSFVERMAARLLAAVFQLNTAKCTKGRFFDRVSNKLSRLGKFATNELVPFDVQAVARALSSTTPPGGHDANHAPNGSRGGSVSP